MRTTTTIAVFRHEQSEAAVWDAVGGLLEPWPVDRSVDNLCQLALDDEVAKDELVSRLTELGARVHVVRRDHLEPDDYQVADYVGIFGADPGDGLVANEGTALVDSGACPECGEKDALDVNQVAAFEIEKTRLVDGFDVVGLPGGGLAVSGDLATRMAGFSGVVPRHLLAAGTPTTRLVQVEADRSVLVPCRQHTVVEGEPHCPECGRARGETSGYFWVSPSQVAGRDLVSRHVGGRAFLFASQRLRAVLQGAGGFWVNDVMRVCAHPPQAVQR